MGRLTGKVRVLTLTLNGQRHVFAAPMVPGKDPMEMTLGEWMAAPALSASALCNDFFGCRSLDQSLPEKEGKP